MKPVFPAKPLKVTRTATYEYRCWTLSCFRCARPTPEIPRAELEALDLPLEREDGIHVWPFQHWWPTGWVEIRHGDEDIDHLCPECWRGITFAR